MNDETEAQARDGLAVLRHLVDAYDEGVEVSFEPKECWLALAAIEEAIRQLTGTRKSDANFKRKSVRLTEALGNQVMMSGKLRYELDRVERLLAWIYRTEQPREEIRRVIKKTIPRRIQKVEAEPEPLPPQDDKERLLSMHLDGAEAGAEIRALLAVEQAARAAYDKSTAGPFNLTTALAQLDRLRTGLRT